MGQAEGFLQDAMWKMHLMEQQFVQNSEGEHKFSALAIHGSSHQPKPNQTYYAYPCGICRQVLSEFAEPDLTVLIVHSENDYLKRTLGELLPDSFGSANLE